MAIESAHEFHIFNKLLFVFCFFNNRSFACRKKVHENQIKFRYAEHLFYIKAKFGTFTYMEKGKMKIEKNNTTHAVQDVTILKRYETSHVDDNLLNFT